MAGVDVCIAGAGVIGLSIALELRRRGASVVVLERGAPMGQASTAAAGMLAVADPENPIALRPLAELSISLYPEYLQRIGDLSGGVIEFHTSRTLQGHRELGGLGAGTLAKLVPELDPTGYRFSLLAEHSLDPRELAAALVLAVHNAGVDVKAGRGVVSVASTQMGVEVRTATDVLHAAQFVDCTGAWGAAGSTVVRPVKGQMLALNLPESFALDAVVRTPDIYIVPRKAVAGVRRAIVGATVEDMGFDTAVQSADIAHLKTQATKLLPAIGAAAVAESWAGLRPATLDGLPLLGRVEGQPSQFIATGHYRNGILLAPLTARVMAQMLSGEDPRVDLVVFDPSRFAE